MNMHLRLIWLFIRSRFRPRISLYEVGETTFRVRLRDLDVRRHMSNAVYLSVLDLARIDHAVRSGLWATFQREKVFPVTVAQTITYRKPLKLGHRFVVETRLAGMDADAVFWEHQFVVKGEIYARAMVRMRVLRRSGGTVSCYEVAAHQGEPVPGHLAVEQWTTDWVSATALPSTRQPAESTWGDPSGLPR